MKQEIASGADSTVYQAGGDIVNQGLSYSDVRQVAEDVVFANLVRFNDYAGRLVEQRVHELMSELVERLRAEPADLTAAVQDPDVQFGIITAGQQYARSGDEEMRDVLVDLLIDRFKAEQRSLMSVVVDDAIAVAPRLTREELSALALSWRIFRTAGIGIRDLGALAQYLRTQISPFVADLPLGEASYAHLVSLGCATFAPLGFSHPADPWLITYSSAFSRGIPVEEIPDRLLAVSGLFQPAINAPGRMAIDVTSQEEVKAFAKSLGVGEYEDDAVLSLFKGSLMTQDEVVAWVEGVDPRLTRLREVWREGHFNRLSVTPVGTAIAHANYRRVTGLSADLTIWIN